jgi:xanthine dehydrogenase accessory factor
MTAQRNNRGREISSGLGRGLAGLGIIIRGGGDLASGVALRLYRAGLRNLLLLETSHPLAVRRQVCFSEAVVRGEVEVEDVRARRLETLADWPLQATIGVLVDPDGTAIERIRPQVVIDAIMAKRNLGTGRDMAPLVIGLGPGFTAGKDVHCVIETMRGHTLGRVIRAGTALADTGVPGNIGGYTSERLLRASVAGLFVTGHDIGDMVEAGQQVGSVDGVPVKAGISGMLRGLLRTETPVEAGTKLGDIDPRGRRSYCPLVSDKALAIGGGVLEAILYSLSKMES